MVLAALLLADFGSGLVHWGADTWGSERMPVLGPRFLRPFRVHHLNPDDILRRGFVDLNGDVALLGLPLLAGGLLIPLSDAAGRLATVFCVALAACSLPTNQIHQWAHRSEAPALGPLAAATGADPEPGAPRAASRRAVHDALLHHHGLVQSRADAGRASSRRWKAGSRGSPVWSRAATSRSSAPQPPRRKRSSSAAAGRRMAR